MPDTHSTPTRKYSSHNSTFIFIRSGETCCRLHLCRCQMTTCITSCIFLQNALPSTAEAVGVSLAKTSSQTVELLWKHLPSCLCPLQTAFESEMRTVHVEHAETRHDQNKQRNPPANVLKVTSGHTQTPSLWPLPTPGGHAE